MRRQGMLLLTPTLRRGRTHPARNRLPPPLFIGARWLVVLSSCATRLPNGW